MNQRVRNRLCFFIVLFVGVVISFNTASAQTVRTMPNVSNEMQNPQYWIEKMNNPNEMIMTLAEINEFNKALQKELPSHVVDLSILPERYTKNALEQYINLPFPKEDAYVEGKKLTENDWNQLRGQLNLQALKDTNPVQYGFTVIRTNLKIFPTPAIVSDEAADLAFDQFQDSAILANEPVLILHQSLDKKWLYIRMYNCGGWVLASDIGICSNREAWLKNQQQEQFLVVTGNQIKLDNNPFSPATSDMEFTMGTILPLATKSEILDFVDGRAPYDNYVVKMPIRLSNGTVSYKLALIPVSKDVRVGFLPYTRANIIKQAFKMQGDRYGWGGMLGARDCSALVLELYRCFGFNLPRNAETQSKGPGKIADLSELSISGKSKLLDALLPGATLHFPGHVMLYLGKDSDRYYVISALGSFAEFSPQSEQANIIRTRTVVVNDLGLKRGSGKQWLEALTVGKQWEQSQFEDLEGWADKKIVEDLANQFIINGRDKLHFDPAADITRAEFSVMLAKALKLEEDQPYALQKFKDVEGGGYTGAIGALARKGYISGGTDGRFYPDQHLTYEQMQSMAERILRQHDKDSINIKKISAEKSVTRYEAALVIHTLSLKLQGE